MKTLYFDCFAGASGDMILGALVGAGADAQALREQLQLLDVSNFDVTFETVDRSGIGATRAHVRTEEEHHHRHLSTILKIIERSRLTDAVKSRAARIFTRLAEAEARVHNIAVEKVHFHEVGAMDAIIDVVGACIGFELLGVERFVASPLHVGSGMVEMAHGKFPIPAPAVVELLRDVPTYASEIQGELLTPTGAAIISTVCESYGAMPAMSVSASGYGAGKREYERFPNVLRVMIGETAGDAGDEKLLVVETNLDDVSPQIVGHVMERAFERGALDCYFTPVQMKKNRPGVLVSILCRPADRESIYRLLFDETTTLGVRSYEVSRRALARESVLVETEFGAIRVKVARRDGRVVNATPEFDDCRAAARKWDAPLRDVEAAARAAFLKIVTGEP
jgi:uncharacterized protein (TIGR00299 family) protein